jgi:SlyX protein
MNENRLVELEIKVAYQDDLLQELNKIVAQQQQHLSLLENTCQLLYERINSVQHEKRDALIDSPPPHY